MVFVESTHTYTHESELYTSVTTFLKKFYPKFDTEGVAAAYAKKHNKSVEEVKKSWSTSGLLAGLKGTIIHAHKEELEYGNLDSYKALTTVEGKIGYTVEELQNLAPGVYPELILYLPRYKLCGTSDKVIIYPDKTFKIVDFKTNREIKKESFAKYDKTTGRKHKQYMFGPFASLEDCNFSHYTVQLSLYAYMLECYGYTCKGLELVHIPSTIKDEAAFLANPSLDMVELGEEVVMEVPYLKREIMACLR